MQVDAARRHSLLSLSLTPHCWRPVARVNGGTCQLQQTSSSDLRLSFIMRKRDRMQNRVRALFTSDTTPAAPPHKVPLRPAQQTSSPAPPLSSPPCPPASSTSIATTSRGSVLEKALAKTLEKLPQAEKAAFAQASKTINEWTLLSCVNAYDAAHRDNLSFRPYAERLLKFLGLLNRFMGGVAISI